MAAGVEAFDSIAILRLASPLRLNALGPVEVQSLNSALASIADADYSALVVTADSCFSVGLDLPLLIEMSRAQQTSRIASWLRDAGTVIRRVLELPIPTLAAVDGPIGGMGLALAIACDLRFFGPAAALVQSPDPFGVYSTVGCSLISARTSAESLAKLITSPFALTSESAAGLGERAKESANMAAIEMAHGLAALPIGARRSFGASNRALALETFMKYGADPSSDIDFIMSADFRSNAEYAIASAEDSFESATFGALDGLYPPAQDG